MLPSFFWPISDQSAFSSFNQNPLLHLPAGTAGEEREFAPDREADDLDDPKLGAAALDDDAAGGGGETGSSGFTTGFDDWPDDDKADPIPRRQPVTDPQGAGPSGGPTVRGSAQKRRAAPTLFGGRPKKPKGPVAATKLDEAAAKAARFRKVVKQPQAVSA